jgi:chemotaxis protein MotB
MPRKKKHGAHANHERWLVSYADFITLLFAFFVVMFASSQTDKGKAAQVSESVKRALEEGQIASAIAGILGGARDLKGKGSAQMKGPGGAERAKPEPPKEGALVELAPAMDFLTREMEEEIKAGRMQISMQARGLVVSFQQAAFFPSGTDEVAPGTHEVISKVAAVLNKLPNPIRLEGHTDSVPISTARFRSNWDLSAARSIALMNLLSGRYGVAASRISVAGYADNVPVEPNDTEKGRARNRRVDIVVLNQLGMQAEPPVSAAVAAPEAPSAKKRH